MPRNMYDRVAQNERFGDPGYLEPSLVKEKELSNLSKTLDTSLKGFANVVKKENETKMRNTYLREAKELELQLTDDYIRTSTDGSAIGLTEYVSKNLREHKAKWEKISEGVSIDARNVLERAWGEVDAPSTMRAFQKEQASFDHRVMSNFQDTANISSSNIYDLDAGDVTGFGVEVGKIQDMIKAAPISDAKKRAMQNYYVKTALEAASRKLLQNRIFDLKTKRALAEKLIDEMVKNGFKNNTLIDDIRAKFHDKLDKADFQEVNYYFKAIEDGINLATNITPGDTVKLQKVYNSLIPAIGRLTELARTNPRLRGRLKRTLESLQALKDIKNNIIKDTAQHQFMLVKSNSAVRRNDKERSDVGGAQAMGDSDFKQDAAKAQEHLTLSFNTLPLKFGHEITPEKRKQLTGAIVDAVNKSAVAIKNGGTLPDANMLTKNNYKQIDKGFENMNSLDSRVAYVEDIMAGLEGVEEVKFFSEWAEVSGKPYLKDIGSISDKSLLKINLAGFITAGDVKITDLSKEQRIALVNSSGKGLGVNPDLYPQVLRYYKTQLDNGMSPRKAAADTKDYINKEYHKVDLGHGTQLIPRKIVSPETLRRMELAQDHGLFNFDMLVFPPNITELKSRRKFVRENLAWRYNDKNGRFELMQLAGQNAIIMAKFAIGKEGTVRRVSIDPDQVDAFLDQTEDPNKVKTYKESYLRWIGL